MNGCVARNVSEKCTVLIRIPRHTTAKLHILEEVLRLVIGVSVDAFEGRDTFASLSTP